MKTHLSAHCFRPVVVSWLPDSILPPVVNDLADTIARSILRRRLINCAYVSLQERSIIRRTSFLSSSAAIVHLGVLLVQDQEGTNLVLRENVFILFIQVRNLQFRSKDEVIDVQVLDWFNTEDIYRDRPDGIQLRNLPHKVIYNFSLENASLGTGYYKVTIEGGVQFRTPLGWENSEILSFRNRYRILKALNPEGTTFRVIR